MNKKITKLLGAMSVFFILCVGTWAAMTDRLALAVFSGLIYASENIGRYIKENSIKKMTIESNHNIYSREPHEFKTVNKETFKKQLEVQE